MKLIEIKNRIVMDNKQLRWEARGYFYRLYEEEMRWTPKLDMNEFRILDETNRLELKRDFLEDEIFMVSCQIEEIRHLVQMGSTWVYLMA